MIDDRPNALILARDVMTAYRTRLTEMDIRRLVKADDDDVRAEAAYKLCRGLEQTTLDQAARQAAQDIVGLLAKDAAEMVRRAMAVTLKASDLIPRDVARRLAADLDSIALPIIASSPVFTDDDLIEIVRAGSGLRQTAVANRAVVSRDVASVVAREGGREAVRILAANDNADLSESALETVVDRFGDAPEIVAAVAYRRVLPLHVTERLIELAGEAVREHLMTRHAVVPETAIRFSQYARERATVDLIDQAASEADLPAFMAKLNARKVLNASLLLRALARGRMSVLEHGLAELAGTPHHRAWLMIHDAGPLGLRAVYDRAGLPPRLFDAFRTGVDVWRALTAEGGDAGGETFRQKMLERFLTLRPGVSRDDLAYLLERMDHGALGSVREAANAA